MTKRNSWYETMIKKIWLEFLILSTLFFNVSIAEAITWYARCDGGDLTQCDGKHDVPMSGAVDSGDPGTLPDCAYSSPNYVIGNQVASTVQLGSGDTIIVDGEQHAGCTSSTLSGRAEYGVGYLQPNIYGDFQTCGEVGQYGCILAPITAGTTLNHTKILGKGWDTGCSRPPQIWGDRAVDTIYTLQANTDLQCLEFTDHSGCIKPPNVGGNIDNNPSLGAITCLHRDTRPDPGRWGDTALVISSGSHNINLTNIWIHGMAVQGVNAGNLTGGIVLTNFHIRANGLDDWGGLTSPIGDNNVNGDNYWNTGDLDYAGCGEKYPATNIFKNLRNTSDIHNCFNQNQGGYGDGMGKSAKMGIWHFFNLDVFANFSDGIDVTYDNSLIANTVRQCTFEANSGAAFKSNVGFIDIENTVAIGNCAWWLNNPIVLGDINAIGRAGNNCNHDSICDANENSTNCADCTGADICRPASHFTFVLGGLQHNSIHKINGVTMGSTGDGLIFVNGSSCDGTQVVQIKNGVFTGGTEYNGGQSDIASWYYAECPGLGAPDADYNFIAGTKTWATDCSGQPNSHCYANESSLNLEGPLDNFAPGYYQGTNYIASYYLKVTSPAHGASSADESVSMQGGNFDATLFNKRLTWDAGGIEYRPHLHLSTDFWGVSP